ncbi:unnamed protein product [Ascophyllum nodosum]
MTSRGAWWRAGCMSECAPTVNGRLGALSFTPLFFTITPRTSRFVRPRSFEFLFVQPLPSFTIVFSRNGLDTKERLQFSISWRKTNQIRKNDAPPSPIGLTSV